jgi:hypothetical protein
MNIFVIDKDPFVAAQYMCDKHISKMLIESAQLMCSAFDEGVAPYKRTHYNHPCAIWTRSSLGNFTWLFNHAWGLNLEYQARYKKLVNHKSFDVCLWAMNNVNKLNFATNELKSFVQCMPDEHKVGDVVESYRRYYRLGKPFAKWDKLNNKPNWMN